jgi:hypothetical protein
MEYYSAMKRNQLFTHTATWMNFKNIVLNEKTKHKEHMLYDFTPMKFLEKESL